MSERVKRVIEKKPRQIIKTPRLELRLSERDYRGILAFMLVIGLIILLMKGDLQGANVLGPLAGASIGWYFSRRRR
ncbi:MAG: hypothetical protein RMJ31_03880 [Nitrososphaerota archaeon]|nr:hypothetical protein [Nitrososphaerales archaeon]MDW8044896.1 hypothetical protein [Nitrososphaerota archaeon]